MKTMYVGNLPSDTTEDDVRQLFSQFGTVLKDMASHGHRRHVASVTDCRERDDAVHDLFE